MSDGERIALNDGERIALNDGERIALSDGERAVEAIATLERRRAARDPERAPASDRHLNAGHLCR
ncbi:hypothetical protein [Sorangium sp. So ce542]|uniref:hypothetical protein n=1 Tax=Sorangium sp. So ce542 TaxID=3133316 RepID=UPI003F63B5CF